jgi:hypothetical protein
MEIGCGCRVSGLRYSGAAEGEEGFVLVDVNGIDGLVGEGKNLKMCPGGSAVDTLYRRRW